MAIVCGRVNMTTMLGVRRKKTKNSRFKIVPVPPNHIEYLAQDIYTSYQHKEVLRQAEDIYTYIDT